MHFAPLEPDDATLELWLGGSLEERTSAFNLAWQRHRDQMLYTLKRDYPTLAWADCEDIVDDAYCCLWIRLTTGEFLWKGKNSLINFLLTISRNDANDLVRKRKRRDRLEGEIASWENERLPEPPDIWIQRMESEALRKSNYTDTAECLIACAQQMKPAQRSVAVVMTNCWVTNARWPSNERMLEILRENEPELKIATVVERRKEVLAKFRRAVEVIRPNLEIL